MTRVSVIIPVYNDVDELERCLRGLASQTWPEEDLDVIVVDNGSSRDVAPALDALPSARLIRDDRPGSYHARNRGLELATGDVIGFIDADCVPDPEWLEAGVGALERGPFDLVGGRILVDMPKDRPPTAAELYEGVAAFDQARRISRGSSVTANLLVRARVLADTGPFRGDLLSGGDVEWCRRATARGWHLGFAPGAVVSHPPRSSLAALAAKARRVVGGIHARRGGCFSTLGTVLRPPVGFVIQVLRGADQGLSVPDRMKVLFVRFFLQGVRVLETLRLCAGRPARRT